MGIDRPDEDDGPTVEPDTSAGRPDSLVDETESPTGERDFPVGEGEPASASEHDASADSDTDRLAYHVEYRAAVEAEYRTALDTWTEALPPLHDAWTEIEKRFPERSRETPLHQTDGLWRGEDVLELNPRQNRETSIGWTEIREEAKDDVLPTMRRVEAADGDRHLVGTEHWLKGEDRLKEKVAERLRYQPELSAKQALAEVPDAVRFTFAYSESRYAEGVLKDIERLKAEGFELIKLKNSWTSDQYKGINSQWRRPESGLRFELQFHTQASFEAKQLTHKAYERIRNPLTSKEEERELAGYQERVNAFIPHVPGATKIANYPPENRND